MTFELLLAVTILAAIILIAGFLILLRPRKEDNNEDYAPHSMTDTGKPYKFQFIADEMQKEHDRRLSYERLEETQQLAPDFDEYSVDEEVSYLDRLYADELSRNEANVKNVEAWREAINKAGEGRE